MIRILLPSLATICLTLSGVSQSATAADWSSSLFPVKKHDFGTVAVASKTEFEFPIQNRTNQNIHISNVRASCGCTTPILEKQWINAGETGKLIARFNTGSFTGKKGATLTVVIDRPTYTEVQLRVDGYIRRDMVFDPGAVDFGTVSQGEEGKASVNVAYAGRSDWEITGIDSKNPNLSATVQETSRTGQRVNYAIHVELRDSAPSGFLQDQLIVRTNDRSMPRIPLAVVGNVEAALTIAPKTFTVNELKPGESYKQRLIVTGQRPFQIAEVACDGFEVKCDLVERELKAHVLNVELVAQPNAGPLKNKLIVRTTDGEELTAESIVTGLILDK